MQSILAQPIAIQAFIGAVGVLVGVLAGLLIRGSIAKSEKDGLVHRNEELANALTQAGTALSDSMALSAKRAGFETLAEEREKRIGELGKELEMQRAGSQVVVNALQTELKSKSEEAGRLAATIAELTASLENEKKSLPEKIAVLEGAKLAFSEHFKSVGTDVLERLSKAHTEGSQKELGNLLNPLREQIVDFRKKVEEVQIDSKTGVTELKTLIGTMGSLNQALTQEAHNLATALRGDTKAQGNWGETILRNILDKSGLQKGVHYSFQQTFSEISAEGEPGQRRQTDVVLNLPGGRHLVIDSKVSLNAYSDSVNAADEKSRAEAIKRHLVSVRGHFTELAGRSYHTLPGIESPDFTVMFVPIEPAFLLALENDEALWHDAYAKGVLLSGPTTVLFVIRIVEDLWRQQIQAENVEKVMKRGAELYDKFVGFVVNLESVGDALFKAREKYEEARAQLSTGPGNLVRRVELLREMGLAPKKQIPRGLLEAAGADGEADVIALNGEAQTEEPTLALAAEAAEGSAEPAAMSGTSENAV
ncbi:MAG TPA: DNA recombination protein RmuC [Terracidiphilus sp.]|nr:DNA recombination protein RmuC [Terracidiphilus sp.]